MSSQIAELFARIGADLSGLESGLGKAESMLTSAGQKISSVGSDLTRNLTLPLAAVGGAAEKAFIDLDEQMRNVQSISNATDLEISKLSDTFVNMSTDATKTTDSAKNLAAGFYQIQSSGFAGAGAMEVLEKSTKAGSAGLSDTATAATALAATLNAYGQGAEQAGYVSDLLFQTVNLGVVSFGELAGSLSNVVGTAAQAGVSFETVSAAITTMTKQGQAGAEATTALNQLILAFIKPSEDMTGALKEMGYASGQAALDTLGLQGTLQALSEAGYNSTESLANLFPNVRALRAALALTGDGAKMFASDLAAMNEAAGSTDRAFEQQAKSISAQIKLLRNEFTALGMDLAEYTIPALQEGMTWLKAQAESWRKLEPEVQKNVVALAGIALVAGPALKIIGGLVTGIGTLAGMFGKLAGALAPIIAGLPTLVSQLGAAFSLMASGEGVFAVATSGLAGFTAAAAPAVAAIAAVAYFWKKFISDTQKSGLEGTSGAWTKFFEDMSSKGVTASQAATQYAAAQQRVNTQIEQANPIVRLFINQQEIMRQGSVQATQAIYEAAKTYGEYYAALQTVGLESEAVSVAMFNEAKGIVEVDMAAVAHTQTLEQIAMKQSQAARATSGLTTETANAGRAFKDMHEVMITYTDGLTVRQHAFEGDSESLTALAQAAEYARNQVARLMGQFNTAAAGGKKSAFQQLVETYGLQIAQLESGAKSALLALQNLLQWMEDNPAAARALGQNPAYYEPPGGTGPSAPYVPPTDATPNTGPLPSTNGGFQVAGGDTYNITIRDQMSAALVMAEVDTRRRSRLGARMGG